MAERLGQLLLSKGLVTEKGLAEVERIQREGCRATGLNPGARFGAIIIRKGFVEPMEVVRTLCEQCSIDDYMLVGRYIVSPSLIAQVPLEVARRYATLPLVCIDEEGSEVLFATNEEVTSHRAAEVEKLLGFSVDWVRVRDRHFQAAVDRVYSLMADRGVSAVRIGEVLVREGLATVEEVDWALGIARRTGKRIGRVLMEEGLIAENDFFKVLAAHRNVPLVTASDILDDPQSAAVASRLSQKFAIFNEVVPFRLDGKDLYVAASRTDLELSELRKIYSCRNIYVNLIAISHMIALLKAYYNLPAEEAAKKGLANKQAEDELEILDDVPTADVDSKFVLDDLRNLRRRYESLVSHLLQEAIRRRASDIHIEIYENFVAIRLRIDGLLYDARTLRIDKDNVAGVVNVIKVLSDINIAERRLPQGGRFRKRTKAGEVFDFRVQCQPTLFGENVVIRILNQSASVVELKALGFSQHYLDRFIQAVVNPSGLILITGPTGSGKTTTLYSVLDLLRRDTTKKIVTIEDPVEYALPRIQQSQTLEAINYDFASATRAFLREDPDIALIGEIRDEETARETIKLSQTGHLVFSTLHTNNAIGAVSRMLVLGIEPELLASELLVVAAQRLARQLCDECRVAYQPRPDLIEDLYPKGVPPGITFYKGTGCAACDGLGHTGRVAIGEFWFIDRDSRLLISRRASEEEILHATVGRSYTPLLADALDKVHSGVVDVSELPTVLPMASITATAQLIQEKDLAPADRRGAAA
ncbi:MAG: GspE/PulE family protein [Planctomycetota bacterium]|jgi:type IV pilus assembly protein PilB